MLNYVHIALWVVCFFDAIILLCLPTAEKLMLSTDGSAARYVVDSMALGIGILVLSVSGWKKLPNITIGWILILMVVSHFHAPNIVFESIFLPHDHAIFDYKPMFELVLFFMMFMGIYSMEISVGVNNLINKSIVWIATIYGFFAVLQRFGLDQFYVLAGEVEHMSRNPQVGGFISQPVFCAAFIAICMPFVIRYGKWWNVLICLFGILATENRSSLIVVLICSLYACDYGKLGRIFLFGYISYLVLGVVLKFIPSLHIPHMGEDRFLVWQEIIKDFTNPMFPGITNSQILTGTGIGSFTVIFPFYHHNVWHQAHNEFLECLRCLGVIGFGLLIYFIHKIPRNDMVVWSAILGSIILAFTNPIWQIPQLAFLSVFLLALAYNKMIGANNV